MRTRLMISVALLAATVNAQDDPSMAQRDLEAVREELRDLEQNLEEETARRDAVMAELRSAEKAEARARSRLNLLQKQLAASQERLAALERDLETGRRELANELAILEQQLRATYMTGQQEWLRLVLSGEDPLETGRQLVYYGYLSRARSALIAGVRERVAALSAQARAVSDERDSLTVLEQQQSAELQSLAEHRQERSRVLARLDQSIVGREANIGRLRAEARELESLVAELSRSIADLSVGDSAPFARRKGGMEWPATGRPVQNFGQARAGGRLRWEGTLLAAPAGSEVRAVHHGRIVFADWLPGLGLLAVVEHGDGYLTLYGHNQDLVKDVGDWVSTGEVLAHVGDSGGRAEPGLYFEIRKDGRPIDPRPWIR
ncbi:MAG: peptidoglycan DD-metalloendopeptidase family protein [Gammaproteobacteria bacterium]|nr:peptidoglycan DD-metalloendopeptidase family protein [Gammaproteobacteria bacterium]